MLNKKRELFLKIKREISNKTIISLTNEDFKKGSCYIDKPGIYQLKENIIFNPNCYDFEKSTDKLTDCWFRQSDQEIYQGKECDHGFFCAILIKSNNVIIDLNGFKIEQHPLHFLQQRFFSLIQLGNSPFIKGQGPGGDWGDLKICKNIVIYSSKKNKGILGRSSHFGIAGNENQNVIIENIEVSNFESIGLIFNNIDNLYLYNCKIKDSNKDVIINSNYAALLAIHKIFRQLISNSLAKISNIKFNNKNINYYFNLIEKYINRIVTNCHFYNQITPTELKDSLDVQIKKIFGSEIIDNCQLSDGSSHIGLQITGRGVAIKDIKKASGCPCAHNFSVNAQDNKNSENIYIKNVEISNLKANIKQTFHFSFLDNNEKKRITGCFGEMFKLDLAIDQKGQYKGNILSDSQILTALINKKVKNLIPSNTINIPDQLLDYFSSQKNLLLLDDKITTIFGFDIMNHTLKGCFGARFEQIKNLRIDNLKIKNIMNHGYLTDCDIFKTKSININEIDRQLNKENTWTGSFGIINTSCVLLENNLRIENIKSSSGITSDKIEINVCKSPDTNNNIVSNIPVFLLVFSCLYLYRASGIFRRK